MITLKRTTSDDNDFQELVKALDHELMIRDGEQHVFYAQLNKTRGLKTAIVAYDDDRPVGSGALRQFDEHTMEVKRMFVTPEKRGQGIATIILTGLEAWAKELKYKKCVLETGQNQPEAIRLYQKANYKIIPNFGKYQGVENSVCFEKEV